MRTEIITKNNIRDFSDFFDPEEAENIGRDFYRSVAVLEDGACRAAVIWELKHSEDDEADTLSRLAWLSAPDEEAGAQLLDEYGEQIAEEEVHLSSFEFPAGIEEKSFLEAQGFDTRPAEATSIVITVGSLAHLPMLKLKKPVPSYINPISELTMREFNRGIINCIFHSNRELTEDLTTLPVEWFDPDLSCYVESDDVVEGFLLVHKTVTGRLKVELLIDVGPDAQTELLHMVRFSMRKALEMYDSDTPIVISRSFGAARKLTKFLFPEVAGEDVIIGRREELA
jgi:hypothetical protein